MAPEAIIAQLAACRERNLDQPDLLEHHSHPTWAWSAWASMATIVELPREVQDVLDEASHQLGLMDDGCKRACAWQRARAGQRCGPLSRHEVRSLATAARLRPVARPGHFSKALALITAGVEYVLCADRPSRKGLLKTLRAATR